MKNITLIVIGCMILLLTGIRPVTARPDDQYHFSGTVGGGINVPQSELSSGNLFPILWRNDVSRGYAISSIGTNFNMSLELDSPAFPFTIVAKFSYHLFSQDTTLSAAKYFEITGRIYSAGIGLQYPFPAWKIFHPFLAADAHVNFINGQSKYTTTSSGGGIIGHDSTIPMRKSGDFNKLSLNAVWIRQVTVNTATRFGMALGAGTKVNLPVSNFFIKVSAAYHWTNLLGKDYTGTQIEHSSIGLNDGANPDNPDDHSRSINVIMISLGIGYRFQ